MTSKFLLNFAVKDLKKSVDFFTQLLFSFNPHFTNEHAFCMITIEYIVVILVTDKHFKEFTKKEICNADKNSEVQITIIADNKKK